MARANAPAIIIRKYDDATDHGHHGGAWKVAYADFMTAMMAFFLLLWIVGSTTKDQLNGIADYFTPAKVSMTAKGGIGALGGTALGPNGIMSGSNGMARPKGMEPARPDPQPAPQPAPQPPAARPAPAAPAAPAPTPEAKDKPAAVVTVVKPVAVPEHQLDEARFRQVQQEIVSAMRAEPDLQPLLNNVQFRQTPEGLQIEVVDQAGRALFASGSAKIEGPTLLLMQKLARVIATLPNAIRISGHTDSVPFAEGAGHDNWDLSSERANATRRVLVSAGVTEGRITRISGVADTEPLKPEDPRDPSNRRITVLLAYQKGQIPAEVQKALEAAGGAGSVAATPDAAPQTAPAPAATSATPDAATPDAATGAAPAQAAAAPAAPADPLALQYQPITAADLARAP